MLLNIFWLWMHHLLLLYLSWSRKGGAATASCVKNKKLSHSQSVKVRLHFSLLPSFWCTLEKLHFAFFCCSKCVKHQTLSFPESVNISCYINVRIATCAMSPSSAVSDVEESLSIRTNWRLVRFSEHLIKFVFSYSLHFEIALFETRNEVVVKHLLSYSQSDRSSRNVNGRQFVVRCQYSTGGSSCSDA